MRAHTRGLGRSPKASPRVCGDFAKSPNWRISLILNNKQITPKNIFDFFVTSCNETATFCVYITKHANKNERKY